jgi:hypothetical protein
MCMFLTMLRIINNFFVVVFRCIFYSAFICYLIMCIDVMFKDVLYKDVLFKDRVVLR